jgi:cytochrome c peroxidase
VLLLLPKPKGEALMIRKLLVIGVATLLAAFWMRQAFIAERTNAARTAPSQQTQPVGTSGSSGAKPGSFDAEITRNAQQMIEDGRKIFRFDTFGDEAFWGGRIDDFQSARSPEQMYRTTPLRGLFTREKGGFYHDGRFKTLDQVVEHYQKVLNVALNGEQKRDLVQYLKSL